MFTDPFEALLQIQLNRAGLLSLLRKAGYSIPVDPLTMVVIDVSDDVDPKGDKKNKPTRLTMGADGIINIRLERTEA